MTGQPSDSERVLFWTKVRLHHCYAAMCPVIKTQENARSSPYCRYLFLLLMAGLATFLVQALLHRNGKEGFDGTKVNDDVSYVGIEYDDNKKNEIELLGDLPPDNESINKDKFQVISPNIDKALKKDSLKESLNSFSIEKQNKISKKKELNINNDDENSIEGSEKLEKYNGKRKNKNKVKNENYKRNKKINKKKNKILTENKDNIDDLVENWVTTNTSHTAAFNNNDIETNEIVYDINENVAAKSDSNIVNSAFNNLETHDKNKNVTFNYDYIFSEGKKKSSIKSKSLKQDKHKGMKKNKPKKINQTGKKKNKVNKSKSKTKIKHKNIVKDANKKKTNNDNTNYDSNENAYDQYSNNEGKSANKNKKIKPNKNKRKRKNIPKSKRKTNKKIITPIDDSVKDENSTITDILFEAHHNNETTFNHTFHNATNV